jgi:putative CocE/NonD family hydrolase
MQDKQGMTRRTVVAGVGAAPLAAALMTSDALEERAGSPVAGAAADKAGPAGRTVTISNVRMPMRDGIMLEADITFPSEDGRTPAAGPFPTLLQRTPYNRAVISMIPEGMVASTGGASPQTHAGRGYAVICQDVRGKHGSEGVFAPMLNEGPDGADTVAWIRRQPWSDGRIGTYGGSYMGGVQMLLAAEAPEGLVTSYSQVAATDQFNHDWPYFGGVLSQYLAIQWCLMVGLADIGKRSTEAQAAMKAEFAALTEVPFEAVGVSVSLSPAFAKALDKLVGMTPVRDLPILRHVPWFRDWIDNRENPAHFQANAMKDRFAGHPVPTMHVGGWYDLFLRNTLSHYQGISTQARDPAVRANQRMIIGPWAHTDCVDCPPGATIDGKAMQVAWMERWFRGAPHAAFDHKVMLYIQGENRWRAEESWPLPGTERTRYYLRSNGRANSAAGDGALSTTPPGDEKPDRYSYDPANPVPSLGGIAILGSRAAQNTAEARDDVLCYTTPPLTEDVEVTGWVTATLFAATSAVDTDWWMRLVDVTPDGTAETLCHGVTRARYRYSRTRPEPVTPGEIVRYVIDMQATGNVFKAGHRIRVEVSSSCFPLGERNSNSMIDPASATEADFIVAEQTVHHDAEHASYVELPIIPSSRDRKWIDTPFPLASEAHVSLSGAGA